MIGILEPENFSASALAELKALDEVKIYDGKEFDSFLSDINILFVRLGYMLDALILDKAPRLQIICSPTTGLNHIDLPYCEKRGIQIISLKGETEFLRTIRATPEHTLGLIIALFRNYRTAFLDAENHAWDRDRYKGHEIFGSKIGIIGLGRVGSILAGFLTNMGADVRYYDTADVHPPKHVVKCHSMSELIEGCDLVALCCSYDASIGSIMNQAEIDQMKDKWFVNTARAELTDEKYLVRKAAEGHFKGIAVDVIQDEQSGHNKLNEWLQISQSYNVIITPHIGGATFTSMSRTEEFIAEKLKARIG
jgi:D-3-phosphoglycerate dehydrogenase